MAATQQAKRIALITSSTRNPRIGPFVTNFVLKSIQSHTNGSTSTSISASVSTPTIETIDLADQNLPLYDEPGTPGHLPKQDPTPHYTHEHTRAWSATIKPIDAFIFITPQYNWSIPASLKNALDFLYHEWSGKPAGIVSYGGHKGEKAEMHLRQIMGGLKMKAVDGSVGFVTKVPWAKEATESGKLPDGVEEQWTKDGLDQQVRSLWDRVVASLQEEDKKI